jgi:hypothetical protein
LQYFLLQAKVPVDNFNLDMDMNLDGKALIEQDKEFADFAGKALVAMFSSQKDSLPLIGALYGFYNIGMDVKQVQAWWKSIQPFTPPKDSK